MNLELKGKRALVTGASRGIGQAIAQALLREGCEDLAIVSSNRESIEQARDHMRSIWPAARISAHAADLKQPEAVAGTIAAFPDIDILVNNAGAISHGGLTELTDAAWLEGWELKVYGSIRLTRGYYPAMAARRSGVVLNIIGYAGDRLNADYIAGSTGNAALIAFTRALGSTSPQDNVRVLGINPGHILTDRLKKRFYATALKQFGDKSRWPDLTRNYPFGRAGSPDEIADAAVFLASARAGYISGTVVTVDGGMTHRPLPT